MKLYLDAKQRELFIKTSLWNSLIAIFQEEKKIDITKYLISIRLKDKKIVVKTNKPILNSEILLFEKQIEKKFYTKIKKIGEETTFDIHYV